ncbi:MULTISPECIES: phosphoenolpyruvate--protein phosphotransferase [unclassified Lentimonas]|uniref:phosphoenolpyruvate--protein phosphotransferase n=1 Tax=unclassified Lentimonas TaxID=2630993 RepID=UPI00132C25EC|nr:MULTISPECIES: phosphoenolpyruvate--protein phosphotransferase [unclassified Lentimonas]CAA6692317.1 Phosphoenolpyruvate-protein phosphotransferase of PTS system (EC [Lentimonas sp. CC10]CAA6694651.1 Phosphoenolpyruvate-protein phosphotransferase of PTS system (EC [Lentimonas sp. CC19]CAA7071400.1 Phosphoenolpyruvate-protein phosphotransferase of PTS system (EC [Lentimonas sp. CC11]
MPEQTSKEEIILEGIAASPGVAHGTALLYLQKELDVPSYDLKPEAIDAEIERFDQAILRTREEITGVRHKVAASLGEAEARIFDAHLMVLEDNALLDEVNSELRSTNKNVESCYNKIAQRYISFFSSMEDEYLKERVTDIRDVSRRLLQNLIGMKKSNLGELAAHSIIVSEDITPSDTADMDRSKLLGFITNAGGQTSHSVIMARSMRIPAVVGLHDATKKIESGDQILVDGYDGIVVINPSEERLFKYGKLASERRKLDKIYNSVICEPSETQDGSPIGLMSNIEGAQEMDQVVAMCSNGVGLFRTEGIFLRHHGYPSESVQYEEYAAVALAAGDEPVIIRTLDIGGDKTLGDGSVQEDNSFMGFRAIRFCLENQDIFKTQLRAILRASAQGNIKIMYPMISGMGELKRANAILEEVKIDLRAENIAFNEAIEVGAMVEIPSAAAIVDILAEEADFFSIGTNDLIQYLMAVDRLNDRVAHLYEPAHPAVLRTLKHIIDEANRLGKPVSVCGEIAGDPIYASLLLGMGATSLSLTSSMLPEVKYFIRKMKMADARALVEEVLQINDPVAVVRRLEGFRIETVGKA